MKMSKQASKAHVIVGVSLVTTYFLQTSIFKILIIFFGVWGGVEIGRYLEHKLSGAKIAQKHPL
jgi:hypothetical protein